MPKERVEVGKEKHERLMKIVSEIEDCLKREKVSITDAEWILWYILNDHKRRTGKLKRIVTVDELPMDEN